MNNDTASSLFIMLLAAIGIIVLIWVIAVPAYALECRERPDGKSYWSYRIIDGQRCWYKGHRVIPKSRLEWPDEPKPKKIKGDPVFNAIRAEDETSVDLGAVTWHMRRPFDQAQPITPPLNLAMPPDDPDVWPDLSEFERRFVGVQP